MTGSGDVKADVGFTVTVVVAGVGATDAFLKANAAEIFDCLALILRF